MKRHEQKRAGKPIDMNTLTIRDFNIFTTLGKHIN